MNRKLVGHSEKAKRGVLECQPLLSRPHVKVTRDPRLQVPTHDTGSAARRTRVPLIRIIGSYSAPTHSVGSPVRYTVKLQSSSVEGGLTLIQQVLIQRAGHCFGFGVHL